MSTWRSSGPPPSERDPKPVGEALDRLSRRLGGPSTGVLASVFSSWDQLVGPDIASRAKPVSLRDGVLTLAVDHPAWAAQLTFMSSDLVARINAATSSDEVALIRIKTVAERGR